jgi:hypothetical protein
MTTPMISNMNKLHDQAIGLDPEDPIVYRHIIGSFPSSNFGLRSPAWCC